MNLETSPMTHAFELATLAENMGEVPVGAVIVKDGEIIGRGYNRRECDHDPCSHAEINAIRNAAENTRSWRLSGSTLYVTLEPCFMCLGAIQQARIAQVYFGAWDVKGGAISHGYLIHENHKLNHRFKVNYSEYPEGAQILSEFFKKRRQTKKQNPGAIK